MVPLQQATGKSMSGFNVIGYTSANFGLGIAARATVGLLAAQGHEVAVADLRLTDGRSGQDHSLDHLVIPEGAKLPHAINIFHVNPPVIGQLLRSAPGWLDPAAGLNVAVSFWELPALPDAWIADLGAMDVVLAPSHFVEQAVANSFLGTSPHIRHYPQTAFLPGEHRPDRVRFALPDGILFAMSFEIASDISRKNPWAAIEAFTTAFRNGESAYLVIKLNTSYHAPAFDEHLSRLRDYAAANNHILLRDERLSYEEVISLYESCDVYVSLHRSEGLGLGAMEAMLLEKPVIATAWSGTMDFMDDLNSCLVGYRLVPVESPVYRKLLGNRQSVWADPLVAEAAAWMRRLFDNVELRRTIGKNARAAMVARHEVCLAGRPFAMIEEIFAVSKERGSHCRAVDSSMDTVSAAEPPRDPGPLFSKVSELLKKNDPAAAIKLYDSERSSLATAPVVVRFDELMQRLREKT
jgi:hypothetical protein